MALRSSKKWRSNKVTRTISVRMAKTRPSSSNPIERFEVNCDVIKVNRDRTVSFFLSAEINVNILPLACAAAAASRTSRISGFVDPLKGQRRRIVQTLLTITAMQVDAPVVTRVSAMVYRFPRSNPPPAVYRHTLSWLYKVQRDTFRFLHSVAL